MLLLHQKTLLSTDALVNSQKSSDRAFCLAHLSVPKQTDSLERSTKAANKKYVERRKEDRKTKKACEAGQG
jgi:hypothetical protein